MLGIVYFRDRMTYILNMSKLLLYTNHRVLEEIDEVLKGRDYVNAEDLDKLQYLNQVRTVLISSK